MNDSHVNGSETGTSLRQALYFKDLGFNLHDTMIWIKEGGGSCGSHYCYPQNTEFMFVLSKGRPAKVNLLRDRPNKKAGCKHSSSHGRRNKDGNIRLECDSSRERIYPEFGLRYNYWLYNRLKGYGNHPATFPEQLAEDHILSWSNEGDIVLDPFVGSGTTAKMAMVNNRHYIGFDISDSYVRLAKQRIAEIDIEELKETTNC